MTESINTTRPIAVPWVLGLFSLSGATFVVAAHMAGWFGGPTSALFLFPFAAVFGGLAQFLAGMWAYQAGDALATAMLGTWGSFWMAYGVLQGLVALGKLSVPSQAFPELGFWFIALAVITWVGAVAALARSWALVAVLETLAAASTLAAIAELIGAHILMLLAGWIFLVSAVCAWYTATAMLFEDMFGREILPCGRVRAASPSLSASAAELALHQTASTRRAG